MKTQKELKEEWVSVWNQNHSYPITLKDAPDYVVELEDGSLIALEKPKIQKRFCYPDHLDDAFDRVSKLRSDPEFFISENLRDLCDKQIERYEQSYAIPWIQSYDSAPADCRIKTVVSGWRVDEERAKPLFSEDRERIISMYRIIRADFEKRLRAYVKRYGLKSVIAWTYWADA